MSHLSKILIGLLSALFIMAGLIGATGWYLSDLLKEGGLVPDHIEPKLDLEVVELSDGLVTLRSTAETTEGAEWKNDGTIGIKWERGYAQVGEIMDKGDGYVVRKLYPLTGLLRKGEMVRTDGSSFPSDPQKAFDIPFKQVSFGSSIGEFSAWFIDGHYPTWVIFVHGRNSDLDEALRMLPTVTGLGLPSLIIHYSNDQDMPVTRDGFHSYGKAEWVDLEGAVIFAKHNGAEELVLVGYSMGGGIVANFLYRSPLAGEVTGVILDSPMLDFAATVDLGAREGGHPRAFVALAKVFSQLRFDIDWEELDYLSRANKLSVPILLFHGDADTVVPVTTSDALAISRSDIVEYHRIPGARHVRSWNTDPIAYSITVRDFLTRIVRRDLN